MHIRFLGVHSRETSNSKCVSILIDQVLALDAGSLASTLTVAEQRNLNAVLLTHSHFDHIRDIPSLAINAFREGTNLKVYSTGGVRQAIEEYMLNGASYPRFQLLPQEAPSVIFQELIPGTVSVIDGYHITAVPVNHPGNAVGYQILNGRQNGIFYTGDTGSLVSNSLGNVLLDLMITEVTFPNRDENLAAVSCHLTPDLLFKGLAGIREQRGYLPRVIVVHRDPAFEREIREELALLASTFNADITIADEGLELDIA